MDKHAEDRKWIAKITLEAKAAGHPYPEMAACEAGLESGLGRSQLYVHAHNLFGTKQHAKPIFKTLVLPTKEFVDGNWIINGNAAWVNYPSEKESFEDRLETLKRLAPTHPHYKAALDAKDPLVFVKEVSKSWSTDPNRAAHVIRLFDLFFPTYHIETVSLKDS